MSIRTLPHDPYIEAIEEALTAAGLKPDQVDVRDNEARGTYMYLDAVITLTPETSGIDPNRWDDGLILVWEWHTGLEEGGDERGPSWQWARLNEDGSNLPLQWLPAEGYASPDAVITALRKVLANPHTSYGFEDLVDGVWSHVDDLDLACEDWARQ